jgi:hypothetical protein
MREEKGAGDWGLGVGARRKGDYSVMGSSRPVRLYRRRKNTMQTSAKETTLRRERPGHTPAGDLAGILGFLSNAGTNAGMAS